MMDAKDEQEGEPKKSHNVIDDDAFLEGENFSSLPSSLSLSGEMRAKIFCDNSSSRKKNGSGGWRDFSASRGEGEKWLRLRGRRGKRGSEASSPSSSSRDCPVSQSEGGAARKTHLEKMAFFQSHGR